MIVAEHIESSPRKCLARDTLMAANASAYNAHSHVLSTWRGLAL